MCFVLQTGALGENSVASDSESSSQRIWQEGETLLRGKRSRRHHSKILDSGTATSRIGRCRPSLRWRALLGGFHILPHECNGSWIRPPPSQWRYRGLQCQNRRQSSDVSGIRPGPTRTPIRENWPSSNLIESGSLVEKARLTSLAEPHAGDWILAQPSKDLGLAFSPNEYHMLVKWRLGLNLFPEKATCGSCPSETLDQFGQHALTCKRGPGICRRHNTLRDCIADYCRRAQLNPTLEAGSGYLNQTRPADILLPTWNLGRDAALDVTVVNPLNNSNIEGAIIPGQITEEAADRKHKQWR